MRAELRRCLHPNVASFCECFILDWAPTAGEASHCLDMLATQQSLCIESLPGGGHRCLQSQFSDATFPNWFCSFANAVHTSVEGGFIVPGSIAATDRPRVWIATRSKPLTGARNSRVRPDFVLHCPHSCLTDAADCVAWKDVLIVGSHESKGSTVDSSIVQLACYASEVFLAQPFRHFVFGILTSNCRRGIVFWRFDRAGALSSTELDYSIIDLCLLTRCLHAFLRMPASALGYHTDSIMVEPNGAFPTEGCPRIYSPVGTDGHLELQQVVFATGGIISRGTACWRGELRRPCVPATAVVVKYAWRSSGRIPEGDLYKQAHSKGVIGLARCLAYDVYRDIHDSVRYGIIPQSFYRQGSSSTDFWNYTSHMAKYNRVYTRLILHPQGSPLHDITSAHELAHGLLAGFIGHASLYFQGQILHRDISPSNIVYTEEPLAVTDPSFTAGLPALHGCLIDLDHAIEFPALVASGANDRTGTYPYMAINILTGRDEHRYRHDLESFLYVLLMLCLYPVPAVPPDAKGIDNPHAGYFQKAFPPNDPLKRWKHTDLLEVAFHKRNCIVSGTDEFEELLQRFKPTHAAFKVAAQRLRSLLWETNHPGIYQVTTGILNGFVKKGLREEDAYTQWRDCLFSIVQELEKEDAVPCKGGLWKN
ncbi:hypothetical protein BDZ91DRAFT_383321 [Kalaharituber pfeilii]|nr:hypothetical protein BDZ91DRAFT_383321 [Kalaharituber pfeilii]